MKTFNEAARDMRRTLEAHKARYVKAYCLHFGIQIDDMKDYELVIQETWDRPGSKTTRVHMRRREEAAS